MQLGWLRAEHAAAPTPWQGTVQQALLFVSLGLWRQVTQGEAPSCGLKSVSGVARSDDARGNRWFCCGRVEVEERS